MGKKRTDPDTGSPKPSAPKTKIVNRIAAALLVWAALISCGEPPAPPLAAPDENSLRYDVNAPFTGLNPATAGPCGSTNIFPLLYSYLFLPGEDGRLYPDLAENWVYAPHRLVWTIFLRTDARFHDRRPVRARDVAASLEQFLIHRRPDLRASIQKITCPGHGTISIALKKDDPEILRKICDLEIFPSPDGEKIDFEKHPIGSGPFKFRSRRGENEVVLEANADYYQGRPSLDKVIFTYQPDREKAWTRLLAGNTDVAQEISPGNFEMIQPYIDRFYFDRYTLRYYTILLYNTRDPLFADPRVRRALAHAIDREHIVNGLLNGFGVMAVGPMGVGSPFHNPGAASPLFDPPKAVSLLQQAGWTRDADNRQRSGNGRHFEFTLLVFKESHTEKQVARYIQVCLNEIGIRCHLRALAYEDLKEKYFANTDFQAVLTEMQGAYRDFNSVATLWTPGPGRLSRAGGFDHPRVTELMRKALAEKEASTQRALFHQADALIISLQPGTFLFQKTAIDAMNRRFSLPSRFNLEIWGIHRLRHATLDPGS